MDELQSGARRINRAGQWRSGLAVMVGGLLAFETLTGLSIYLLPFSIPNQMAVLLHTAGGLVFVIPFAVYQLRHWLIYRRYAMTHIKLTGYIAVWALILCGVSGLVLTWQAAFGRQIGVVWDLVHIITTFAIIAFAVPHVVLIILRDRAGRSGETAAPVVQAQTRYGLGLAGICLFLLLGIALASELYEPVRYRNVFPADYSMPYGPKQPFTPSLATTATGGAYDAASLSGSKTCGQRGCHEDIYREWSVSAHRWASMDPAFQGIQNVMAKQNGPVSTRYCGGCHDPISLFSGTKNIFAANLTALDGYQEGVSCIVCHAIKKTDIKGNANYVITQPRRYIFEQKPGAAARFAANFLIRAYPRMHNKTFNHRLFKSPEFCAACHKQFIDKEVNKVGWVQLQNQYDNWRKSHWNTPHNPRRTIECRECHMPLQKTRADTLARNPLDYNRTPFDGMHRSHRFLGANQFIPPTLKLPGWQEQTALTEKWLQGKIDIPEIASKWATGPAVPISISAPPSVAAGTTVSLTVGIHSNKVGHDFPTGPLDIIQSWLEVEARDDAGRLVYASGRLDDRHFIEKGSFIFRAEPVDQNGNLIERHNLWEMVGVRYKLSIFPGFWDHAEFSFPCPASFAPAQPVKVAQTVNVKVPARFTGNLHVRARLRYRKIGQFLVNFVFGPKSGITCPVTDLSTAEALIRVNPPASKLATLP
ncbi:MAG: multiheme c-type cytochrome [Chthonomonadales bacterium]